ncbi:MAG TPA: hypothetical protein VLV83_18130 [Acidobacteriota bacterium]|nr:hypothetical protein [Acidobacteriota bacterium]
MTCFTLDSNCIIDLEEERPNAKYLMELIELSEKASSNARSK